MILSVVSMTDYYLKKELKKIAPEILDVLKASGVDTSKYEQLLKAQAEEEQKRQEKRKNIPDVVKRKKKKQVKETRANEYKNAVERLQLKEDADDKIFTLEKIFSIAETIKTNKAEETQKQIYRLNDLMEIALKLNPKIIEQERRLKETVRKRQEILDKIDCGNCPQEIVALWRLRMLESIINVSAYTLFKLIIETMYDGKAFRQKPSLLRD